MARKPLRPLIRSGGFYPSRKWTPLVYAGGYTTANGGEEPAPPPIEKTIIGNPIHILDALAKPAQALSIALEPIQDLHGYDNPWPAGGGKNKLDVDAIENYTAGSGATTVNNGNGTITVTANAYSPNINCGKTLGEIADLTVGETYILTFNTTGSSNYIYLNGALESWTNGNAKTITQDMLDGLVFFYASGVDTSATISNLMIRLSSVADATFAPYSNLCPISGHTDADVTRTGKNLLDKSAGNASGSNWWIGTDNVNGEPDGSFVLNAGTYTFSVSDTMTGLYVRKNGSNVAVVYTNTKATFTLTESTALKLMLYKAGVSTSYWDTANLQLELGSTATDYEEYRGTTYPIPLGQTVYGGTLDVVTGVLTVDKAMVDLGALDWSLGSTNQSGKYRFIAPAPNCKNTSGGKVLPNAICEALPTIWPDRTYTRYEDGFSVNIGNHQLLVYMAQYEESDAATFKAAMNGVHAVYELDEPVIIPLTLDTPIELLLGENNIWSDGEMTLVYLADGNASDVEALNILLGGRYTNTHGADEPSDREALNIILGGNER